MTTKLIRRVRPGEPITDGYLNSLGDGLNRLGMRGFGMVNGSGVFDRQQPPIARAVFQLEAPLTRTGSASATRMYWEPSSSLWRELDITETLYGDISWRGYGFGPDTGVNGDLVEAYFQPQQQRWTAISGGHQAVWGTLTEALFPSSSANLRTLGTGHEVDVWDKVGAPAAVDAGTTVVAVWIEDAEIFVAVAAPCLADTAVA